MSEAVLHFVVPVRHHKSVADWETVLRNLALTLRSMAAQTSNNWRGVVVANRGAPLPALPPAVEVCWVDLPLRQLPDPRVAKEEFQTAVRDDKGRRILAGIDHLGASGYTMVVDYDDIISNKLAETVSKYPGVPGWYFDDGYLFSGGNTYFYYRKEFYEFCGTSHIVRTDLLLRGPVDSISDVDVQLRLGSHKFIKKYLEKEGDPLDRLPYVGAMYRVGHGPSVSGSRSLIKHLFQAKDVVRHPLRAMRKCKDIRFSVPDHLVV